MAAMHFHIAQTVLLMEIVFRIKGVAGNNLELSLGCKVAQIRSCGSWFEVEISLFMMFVYVFTLFIGLS